ncbi:hypothetical protein [Cryobacterium sp. GrIS_2_6]|uniref:hypothetical protein n=1 Tax=Cryobacterium sp. GrIS_2_6 TaxID=3162785 RepID=UPI002E0779D9|nr:hypothetical protein [Cryobacterium psychrotolerans]
MRLEPRDDGTFLFPPSAYSDVASYADFWTRVEISDGVLANITKGYADLIRTQVSNLGVNWSHKYDYDHDQELHHGSESSRDTARARRTAAWDKVKADVYTRCPEKIKAGTARTIARAGQAVFYRSALPDENHDELTQATMSIL